MASYDFAEIERKWQAYWDANGTFVQPNPGQRGFQDRPKYYVLDMFPYPSGAGLHVGHPEGYTASDIVARYKRMKGFNVLHPMGYDSFGLPAEQYAVEHGVHPRVTTARNIENIERQIRMFGFSYDWTRRVATTDVEYYRWTQWIFLRLFNSWYDPRVNAARPIKELIRELESGRLLIDATGEIVPDPFVGLGALDSTLPGLSKFTELSPSEQRGAIDGQRLAYIAEVPVNWCPKLGTVLANEEVTNEGKSDRGNHPVYRRAMKQWMLRITAYAERLAADIETVDWPESIKIMQRNWIGRSEGAEVDFRLDLPNQDETFEQWLEDRKEAGFAGQPEEDVIRVFTTRPDTLFGATYMVLAPEHPLVQEIATPEQRKAVDDYVQQAANKSEMERTADAKEKTGVFTGAYAINPVSRQRVPVWVADYVMMGYGTGAIMAVPAHDTRDFEFATKFDLPVVQVVAPPKGEDWHGYVGDGVAVNSGPYDGLTTSEVKKKIAHDLAKAGLGVTAVKYKIRDWLFSRQRYWGEPFPIVHCPTCGVVALTEDQLPLELPEMEDFTPAASDDPDAMPQPPLNKAVDWVNTVCPCCGGPATRETNTMPQWAGSCWYYLRYLDPRNGKQFCDRAIQEYWMGGKESGKQGAGGVDLYIGGAEHAVLHLLYSRFWHKVLFDLGLVATSEPFRRLFNQGMIQSYTYRDSRGVSIAHELVTLADDKAVHKETGETLAISIEKMSKSLKNVVNPDEIIGQYGADTFRLYEMFMGPLEATKPWNTRDVPGVHRFLNRVWRAILGDEDNAPLMRPDGAGAAGGTTPAAQDEVERALHKLIKKAGEDIEAMKFNTTIAAMMEFVNLVFKAGRITQSQAQRLVLVLAPMAPHVAEELWQKMGHDQSLAHEPWPAYDESLLVENTVEMVVQVNGKMRARITLPIDASQEQCLQAALADPKVAAAIEGKQVIKKIAVPGKLVNIVVK